MVVTGKVGTVRGKSTINGENRLLIEVVDPEPLTGDHARSERRQGNMNLWKERGGSCGKRETGSGQRDIVWWWKGIDGVRVAAIGKAKQCQSIEAFTGGRKSTWDTVVIIEKVNSFRH